MLSIPVPFTSSSFDFYLPFPGWPGWVRVLLVLATAAVLVVLLGWLYRREVRLVPKRVALLLMTLRLAAVLAIFLTTAADPTFVMPARNPASGWRRPPDRIGRPGRRRMLRRCRR